MTLYNKDEPYIIGVDFDGTITTEPLGGNNFPPPQEGFIDFYNFVHKRNIEHPESQIYFCIHTARNLDNDENWQYVKDYLCRYQLNEVFLPKRDGKTIKNNLNKRQQFPIEFSYNSKIPCSCYVDDINIGTPKIDEHNLDWEKISKLIIDEVERLERFYNEG
jgi:hypothetical protein